MKKILFLLMVLAMASTAVLAQEVAPAVGNNPTFLQPAGSYIYYGNQIMDKKDCVEFLSTRHQPSYEMFQSGYKCYAAGWWTLGAGLAVDLAGSILWAFGPKQESTAMFWSGATCIIVGAAAVIASIPTIYIGYGRMGKGIDMYNQAQAAAAPQAYWTIQGTQNGLGLALHF